MTQYGSGLIKPPFPFTGTDTGQSIIWNESTPAWTVDYPVSVQAGGNTVGSRRILNFSGSAITSISDDPTNDAIDIVVDTGKGLSGGSATGAEYILGSIDQTGTLINSRVLISVNTINVTNDSTNKNLVLEVNPDSCTQRVEILNNGSSAGTRKRLNFIGSVSAVDNSTSNRVDITVSASPVDVKYVTLNNSTVLPNCRTLAAGTGITLSENISGKSLTILAPDNLTNQKVHILNGGNSIGTRAALNFSGTAISSIADNSTNDRIDIVLNAGSGSSGADPNATYLLQKSDSSLPNSYVLTAGNGIALSTSGSNNLVVTSTGTISVSLNNGTAYSQQRLNFTGDVTVANDSSNGCVDIAVGNSKYILWSDNNALSNAYVLTAGTGISLTVNDGSKSIVVATNTTNSMEVSLGDGTVFAESKINFVDNGIVGVVDNSSAKRIDVTVNAAGQGNPFLVYGSLPSGLTNSKILTAGNGISLTSNASDYIIASVNATSVQNINLLQDGNAKSTIDSINFTGNVSLDTSNTSYTTVNMEGAPTTSKYVIYPSADSLLTNANVISAGAGIILDNSVSGSLVVKMDPAYEGVKLRYNSTSYPGITEIDLSGNAISSFNVSSSVASVNLASNFVIDQNGSAIGTRSTINLIASTGINLTCADNSTNSRVDVTISAPQTPSNYDLSGSLIGSRSTLNFIPGTGINITGSDDSTNNKVDVTISAPSVPPPNFKVNGSLIGSRSTLNFLNNTANLIISGTDDSTNSMVDISISNDSAPLYYEQYADSSGIPSLVMYNFTVNKLLLPSHVTGVTTIDVCPMMVNSSGVYSRPSTIACTFDNNGNLSGGKDSSNYYTVQITTSNNEISISGYPSSLTCNGICLLIHYTDGSTQKRVTKMI